MRENIPEHYFRNQFFLQTPYATGLYFQPKLIVMRIDLTLDSQAVEFQILVPK